MRLWQYIGVDVDGNSAKGDQHKSRMRWCKYKDLAFEMNIQNQKGQGSLLHIKLEVNESVLRRWSFRQ